MSREREESKTVKIADKDDSDRDTNEDTDIDTDEDKRRDNRTRLKDYRRQLDKLWESTIEVGKTADAIAREWKIEREKLQNATNNKQIEMKNNYNAEDWLMDDDEEEILPRSQILSKIPKQTSVTTIPTPKTDLKPLEIPKSSSASVKKNNNSINSNNLIKPAKLLPKPK